MECAVFLWKMINFAVFLMNIIYIKVWKKILSQKKCAILSP